MSSNERKIEEYNEQHGKKCWFCKGTDLSRGCEGVDFDLLGGDEIPEVRVVVDCKNCGGAYTEFYQLTNIEPLNEDE